VTEAVYLKVARNQGRESKKKSGTTYTLNRHASETDFFQLVPLSQFISIIYSNFEFINRLNH
jgi:hypothetical protein